MEMKKINSKTGCQKTEPDFRLLNNFPKYYYPFYKVQKWKGDYTWLTIITW